MTSSKQRPVLAVVAVVGFPMRAVILAVVAARCAALRAGPTASTGESAPPAIAACESTLDALHAAAARADGDAYFECFAADAVFLGTAPDERWPRAEFERYARARFAAGDGWRYTLPERAGPATAARHVTLGPGGGIAWFDEALVGEKLASCRGSGVLVREEGGAGAWRIAQYSLTMTVPNEAALDVAALTMRHQTKEL